MTSSFAPGQLVRVKTFTPKELQEIRDKGPKFTSHMDKYMDHLGVVTYVGMYVNVAHVSGKECLYDQAWLILLDPKTCGASAEEIKEVMGLYDLSSSDILPPGTHVQCAENIPNEKLDYVGTFAVSGKKFVITIYDKRRCSYHLRNSEGQVFVVERWFVSPVQDKDDDDDDILRAISETEAKFTAEIAALKEKLGKRKRE